MSQVSKASIIQPETILDFIERPYWTSSTV